MKSKHLLLTLLMALLVPWAANAQETLTATRGTWQFAYFYGQTVTGASGANSSSSSLNAVSFTQHNFLPKTTFIFTPSDFDGLMFVGTEDDDWNNVNNWVPAQIPTLEDDVILCANATLDSWGAVNTIVSGDYSLTIVGDGQLNCNSSVVGTIQKEITPFVYTTEEETTDNYYFLAVPVMEELNPADIEGMTEDHYDLYTFDESQEGAEWINAKDDNNGEFVLTAGTGYLYANDVEKTLSFTGTFLPSGDEERDAIPFTLQRQGTRAGVAGFNLIGNPFSCEAYIIDNFDEWNDIYYYVLDGDFINPEVQNDYVKPGDAVFVQAETDGEEILFVPSLGWGKKSARATMKIVLDNNNRSGKHLDMAHLCFGQGRRIEKLMLNENNSKIYFSQDNAEYAVVYTENAGEMPLNFKAQSNGTYSLSFSNENVEFNYLHLIDNMTGADVDLLATPSYSFEAKSTDYASRFKIVFAIGATDDNFAFFSNGSFVISNEGNATVQVLDVTGRIVNSESINGSASISIDAAPGVYMIRLVNGDNVKVQKVVVK